MTIPSSPRSLRSIAVAVAASIGLLGACSAEQRRGEGYLFLDDDALLLCESVEPAPPTCVGPGFGVDTFLVLDLSAVQMAEEGGIQYSVAKVNLIETDPVGFFVAIPLAGDK